MHFVGKCLPMRRKLILQLCPDALYTDYTRGINRSYNVVLELHFLGSAPCIGWLLGFLNARRDLVRFRNWLSKSVLRLDSGDASGHSMRLNENICIVGKSVVLMPYKAEYVPE